ncbi:hypothetical protein DdX_10785 [Ditylenchus destructor]|uniref:Uncharacterized protein n=1 Tax=Ditylenchus destructor TaxID=166010 RepID=A0AAD4MYB3_9BILA|nr:hypothetical protein DdX_10785 [Ditylenchus destructor]
MSATPAPVPYLTTLTIVERIIAGTCQLVTIVLFSNLLLRTTLARFWRKATTGPLQSGGSLSNSLILYMTFHAVLSFSGLPYQFLLIWKTIFSSSNIEINPYTVFWMSLTYNTYVSTSPVPMFFLTLDRCLVLWLGLDYSQYSRLSFVVSIFSTVFVYAGLFLSGTAELPLNLEKVSKCTMYTCFSLRNHAIAHIDGKLVLEIVSLCISVCFLFILRLRTQGHHTMLNRIVKITVIAEVCCNVTPSVGNSLFNKVTGLNIGDYAGPYVAMLFVMETAFCSARYTTIFLGKQKLDPGGSSNLPHSASNR